MISTIKVKDPKAAAETLSQILIEEVKKNPRLTLGLITGSTPIETYNLLAKDHQQNGTDWSGVTTFNLDEYVGLHPSDANSYRSFMHENLFKHLNLKHINLPYTIGDLNENIASYEAQLKEHPIDIQLLGVGENGHIGFNEPLSSGDSRTRLVSLSESTIQANKRFFPTIEAVPTQAVTMGIANILEAKRIILVALGEKKRDALRSLLQPGINPQWPCTYLQQHPNVTVIADEAALPN